MGRLTAGKGIELLEAAIPEWLQMGMKLVVLGLGEPEQEAVIARLADQWPSLVVWKQGYFPALARRIYGGADMLLMPSEREACGISQQIAMRYGCIPVARKTGGLADTIEDGTTGFLFESHGKQAFTEAMTRALAAFRDESCWSRLMRTAMTAGGDWTETAEAYLAFYEDIVRASPCSCVSCEDMQ